MKKNEGSKASGKDQGLNKAMERKFYPYLKKPVLRSVVLKKGGLNSSSLETSEKDSKMRQSLSPKSSGLLKSMEELKDNNNILKMKLDKLDKLGNQSSSLEKEKDEKHKKEIEKQKLKKKEKEGEKELFVIREKHKDNNLIKSVDNSLKEKPKEPNLAKSVVLSKSLKEKKSSDLTKPKESKGKIMFINFRVNTSKY